MGSKDYYKTLNVPKGASEDEIRKAYRALAKKFHPDYNDNNQQSTNKFREIVEAYKTLIDEENRRQYDRLGALYSPDGKPPSREDLGTFLASTVKSFLNRKPKKKNGTDILQELKIQLEDIENGSEKTVQFKKEISCTRCKGDGAEPRNGKRQCEECKGTGKVGSNLLRRSCQRCGGKGFVIIKRCKQCAGIGRLHKTERKKIKIPKGINGGQTLRLKNQGNEGKNGGIPGDVLLSIKIAEHHIFKQRGDDLLCDVPLTWVQAISGCEIEVPTLGVGSTIRIPSGTQSHKIFKLAGRGLPSFDGKRNGDLLYRVIIETPVKLSPEVILQLKKLENKMGPSSHPQIELFKKQLKQRSGK